MECYKVVTRSRKSIYAPGKYELTYEKGQVVYAVSNTIGIMVFDSIAKAHYFAPVWEVEHKVLRVLCEKQYQLPIPDSIPYGGKLKQHLSNINNYYKNVITNYRLTDPPSGTLCFSRVLVLD